MIEDRGDKLGANYSRIAVKHLHFFFRIERQLFFGSGCNGINYLYIVFAGSKKQQQQHRKFPAVGMYKVDVLIIHCFKNTEKRGCCSDKK